MDRNSTEREDEEVHKSIRSDYECPRCDVHWSDYWDSACDDDCPRCGMRHISPYDWEEEPDTR